MQSNHQLITFFMCDIMLLGGTMNKILDYD